IVVRGTIPEAINGTFYRVSQDPIVPPAEHAVSIDGHGVVSAFRVHEGQVDFKVKYIRTERYLTERKARKSLFGLYKNTWSDHPCVKGVVDSTANTNIIYWAEQLLALRESANPYSVHPDTLQTNGYDPFGKQVNSEAFTAHPKIDPFTNELNGVVKSPYVTFIHDMVLTENFIVLILWPFEASVDRMKAGGHHFAYDYDLPASFIVMPRRPEEANAGWKKGEYRVYETKNLDFVGFELDLSQPTGTKVPEPRVLLDIPNEFPRIDERYMSKKYEIVFSCVFYPGHSDTKKLLFSGPNAVSMLNTRTGEQKCYSPGENCYCQEPAFVPRSDDAPEGDGWVMFVVERRNLNLPMRVRPQIHGNWVDARELNDQPLIDEPGEIKLSGKAINLKIDA
ncbi:unnamed protein product, partial [Fusarium graminearum]